MFYENKEQETTEIGDCDLTDTPKEKTLAANLKLGPDEYSMKAGVKVAGAGGSTVKYEPFLDYKAPQTGQPSKLVTRKGAKQTASTYSLTGAVNVKSEQEKTTYDLASLSLHTPKIVLTANGHILRKPEFLDTDLKITYDKENVAIKAKFDFSGHPDAIITLAIAPSEFPDFGINANWVLDVENDYETIDSVITVVHGPDPNSEDARITIKNYFHIKDDEQHQEFATKNAVTYPILNFGVKLNAEFKPHSLGYDIGGKFADYEGSSSLNAKWSMKAMMDYHYQFKNTKQKTAEIASQIRALAASVWPKDVGVYEGHTSSPAQYSSQTCFGAAIATNHAEPKTYSIEIESSHNLVEEDKSKFANKLEITPGGKYMLNADVIHKIDDDDIHLNVDAELHLPVEPSVCRMADRHAIGPGFDSLRGLFLLDMFRRLDAIFSGESPFLAGIKSDDNEASGLLKVSAGSKKYVDFTYNIKQTPHPSGKYNLLLPGFVKSNGDFVLSPSNFKSSSKIELSKYGRTMEAKADIKIAEPKYTGYFLVNWDTKKPDKTLKIETNSMFSHNEFDTKNTIIFENQKTQLNLKGKSTGTCEDGSQSGEVELILPNTRHVIGRFSRAMETEPGDNEGEIVVELIDYEKKGDQPTKLMLKLVGKHVDWQRNQFDGQAAATYTDKHGKDLAAHATLKKMPTSQSREKWTINGQYQVHGSLITTPLDIKFDSEVHSLWLEGKLNPDNSFPPLTYHVTSSAGEGRTLDAVGKLNGNILSNELTVKLPKGESPTLHTLKWTTNCNIVAPVDPAHHLKIKSNNVLAWNGDKFFKTNCDFTEEDTGAKIKLEWESDSFSKRTFTVSGHGIECEKAEDKCAYDFSFANDFDGKHADVTVKVDHDYGFNWANVHMLGTTFDAQKFDILVKNKEIKEGKGELTELVATIGQKKYTGNSHVEVLDGHILVDLSLEQPEGKSRFMWKHDKKGELHFANQLKVKWIGHGGGTLNSDHEMNLNSLNELLIDGTLDSAALGIDNLQIHVANGAQNAKGLKGAKGGSGKGISFYVKKAGKNLYSGNLSYNVKITDDHGSFEGSGNMKIGDKPYPLSVKANFAEKDDDQELKITASAGPFSLNGDYKKSKNEFKFQRTICRNGKNDCSTGLVHFYRKLDGEHKEHKIEVIADLSFWSEKIHDIKFLALTKETKTSHEENLDLVWSPTGKLKYHYHLAPRKMIALLEVPSRTLAYEVEVATPHTSKEHSSGRMDANFWWHKKADPNKKLSAQITWDYKDTKTLTTLSGDLQFTAPSLSRPLKAGGKLSIKEEVEDKVAIDGHADIDIFAEPSQAIKAALKINSHADEKNKKFLYNALLTARSPGLKMDMKYDHKFTLTSADSTLMSSEKFTYLDSAGQVRDSIFNVHITPQKLIVLLKFPDFVFLDFNGKIEKKTKGGSEEVTVLTANSNILGAKYRETLTVNPTPMYKYQLVFSKAGGEKILDATLGFKKGGELKVNFDKKKLIDMHIELTPDNYLKPKYTFDIENSEHFYNTVNAELAHISQLTENAAHQLVEKGATEMAYVFGSMARALPDTGPMVDALNKELEAIRAEIASDVYLKDVLGDL
ncbi:hypothetical protein AAG570_004640 [Ranatra chinensis]|uniref:Uncharacterized protein n=1 Tax=Ranatra chinensis TaxID=642074 RepID=A0ABD0YN98_9HEMI